MSGFAKFNKRYLEKLFGLEREIMEKINLKDRAPS